MLRKDILKMRKLDTIQKRNNLNTVYAVDEPGIGNANHAYQVVVTNDKGEEIPYAITFQNGPRKEKNSIHGLLDTDLLEIVRDRLKWFQSGDYACRENALALTALEEALLWMQKRVDDRASRGVLGTNNK